MELKFAEVEKLVAKIKEAIENDMYAIDFSKDKNASFVSEYLASEERLKNILLGLDVYDYSEARESDSDNFAGHIVYIFGKEATFIEQSNYQPIEVPLYIKLDYISNEFVFVISFHRQEWPLKYAFSKEGEEDVTT